MASHICSYPCYFSQFADAADVGRCRLWADESVPAGVGNVNAAYCAGFPYNNPVFPLPEPSRSFIVLGRRHLQQQAVADA